MLINTIDEDGAPVRADVDDHRIGSWRHFIQSHPDLLGNGAGARYGGKTTARDAQEAFAFAVSQLAYVEQKTYERQYAPIMFEKLLPGVIDYSDGEWAQSIEYQIIDYVGMGKRISPMSNDSPYADVAYARKSYPVALGSISYFYTTEDLRISAFLKRPLPIAKAMAATQGYRRHINAVALVGEAPSNYTGLFNNPNITPNTTPSGGLAWTNVAKTADQIIADVITMITGVMTATSNNSMPTSLAVGIPQYAALLKMRNTASDLTVLAYLQNIYPGLKVTPVLELATAGTGASARVVAYTPDDDNMSLHVPMPLRFLAPQLEILRIIVPGEYKYAGLEIRRPLTAYYLDNT